MKLKAFLAGLALLWATAAQADNFAYRDSVGNMIVFPCTTVAGICTPTVSATTAAGQTVDLIKVGGAAIALGQGAMAASIPVAISSDQTVIGVGGNVAAGATDSGNPVKTGGVYNSTKPTLTNGQRGDLQLGTRGNLIVQLSGADAVSAVSTTATNVGFTATAVGLITGSTTFAQLDDVSPTVITENQQGPVRMDASRNLGVAASAYPPGAVPSTATSGLVSNASAVATLTGVASRTMYITGFQCTPGSATAAAAVSIVVSGLITGSNTMTAYATNATTFVPAPVPTVVTYPTPVPASAQNTSIVVTMGAVGTGGTTAVCNAQGFTIP